MPLWGSKNEVAAPKMANSKHILGKKSLKIVSPTIFGMPYSLGGFRKYKGTVGFKSTFSSEKVNRDFIALVTIPEEQGSPRP